MLFNCLNDIEFSFLHSFKMYNEEMKMIVIYRYSNLNKQFYYAVKKGGN